MMQTRELSQWEVFKEVYRVARRPGGTCIPAGPVKAFKMAFRCAYVYRIHMTCDVYTEDRPEYWGT